MVNYVLSASNLSWIYNPCLLFAYIIVNNIQGNIYDDGKILMNLIDLIKFALKQ